MSTEMKPTSANSICIPRAFANISEARVRKVFDALNIFVIDRVDMIQRKNEKGEPFQRIFVHIREWSETADAQKAKERLLTGKDLKIVYDDPWFWKVSLNTWTPKPAPVSLYDRKSKIRIEFDEDTANVDAAAALLGSLNLGTEDQRPYRERRLDPVYCDQDRNQGFKDRRPRDDDRRSDPRDNRRDGQGFREDRRDDRRRNEEPSRRFKEEPSQRREAEPSRRFKEERDQISARDCRRHRDDETLMMKSSIARYEPRSPSSSPPPRRQEKTVLPPATSVAPALQEVETKPVEVAKPIERDQSLVTRMEHAFRCKITDEIYLANRQNVRDQMHAERTRPLQFGEVANNETPDYKKADGTALAVPKKKGRKFIMELNVEDK